MSPETSALDIRTPPDYCEYAGGACDQSFDGITASRAVVLYPSEPAIIASVVEAAVEQICARTPGTRWLTWRDFATGGQIIFCAICRSMRFTDAVIADVTTLNFNLLFEIGFAFGLELPVIPIRDTSYIRDKTSFDELGLLDIVGYRDFQNAGQLADSILAAWPPQPIPIPPVEANLAAPLYVMKGPLETEGEVRLLSILKKSAVRFRTYDPIETPRISLQQLRRNIGASLGVIAHLLNPERRDALVHNARCALAAGIAVASGRAVKLVQEGTVPQPIDYRDIVSTYTNPARIEPLVEPTLREIIQQLQQARLRDIRSPANLLQKLDIGDVAAENEIRPLRSYFVETGQFAQARRGYARLVVGRKGAGKTAIFYAVRDSFGRSHSRIVLDLKPEGHQFTRLREIVLEKLSPGLQEAALTAFWNAILLFEITHKIIEDERTWASRERQRRERYDTLEELYSRFGPAERGDFSERLLHLVNRLVAAHENLGGSLGEGAVAEALFRGDIRTVNEPVAAYLDEKEEVWLLVDNLDKGWPTRGARPEDILILRTLLEATRKLQRQLERRSVNFHCLVFLRNDIFEHLVAETPDKGKDTAITLDWSDPELFKEIFRRRVLASGLLDGNFERIWAAIMSPNVRTEDSFGYILQRTLMRPRDFLMFVHQAIEVAINRGHDRVHEDDIVQAERLYSEDLLKTTTFELKDVYPDLPDLLYGFLGCSRFLEKAEVERMLRAAGVGAGDCDEAIRMLCWFGFLGVLNRETDELRFGYELRYDMTRLLAPVAQGKGVFAVHPAFRVSLECT